MKKTLIFIIILLLISSSIFIWIRNIDLKKVISVVLEDNLGVKVDIGKIETSPLLVYIGLERLTIYNPPGFNEPVLAYIPYAHIVLDPLEAIISKKPNIYLMAVSIDYVHFVRKADGSINIEQLGGIRNMPYKKKHDLTYTFKVFELTLDEIRFTDYKSGKAVDKVYPVKMDSYVFNGLSDFDDVVKIVTSKAIENSGLGSILDIAIGPVGSSVVAVADSSWKFVRSNMKSAWDITNWPLRFISGK